MKESVSPRYLALLTGILMLVSIVNVADKELLAPVGKRLGATAVAAFAAARESGKSEFQNLGLTKGGAKDQVKTLVQNMAGAAATAGKAAASAGKKELSQANEQSATPSTAA